MGRELATRKRLLTWRLRRLGRDFTDYLVTDYRLTDHWLTISNNSFNSATFSVDPKFS
jgi:hypothetical protein